MDKYFEYLDRLRESGRTNMFEAAPYLRAVFPELSRSQALTILAEWMRTYGDRHPKEGTDGRA